MNDEPTKACVRVLRVENKIISLFRWIVSGLIKISIAVMGAIGKIFDYIFDYINWCIVRAFVRWFGLVIFGYLLYYFITWTGNLPYSDRGEVGFVKFLALALLLVGIAFVVIECWINIPEQEKAILYKGVKHEAE
jgi:hypothetical protein